MISSGRPKRSTTARRSRADAALPTTAPASATPHFVARLVPLDPGFYAFSLTADTTWRESVAGLALPAVQVCAAPDHDGSLGGPHGGAHGGAARGAVEITDSSGHAGSWLGGRHRVLFVKSPAGGGAALVTGYLARDPDSMPLQLDIRRLGPLGFGSGAATPRPASVMTLRMGSPAAAERSPQAMPLEIIAHIRGRGDVRFVGTPWVGRLGPGMWIEAFMVLPRSRSADAAIEYKGLTASGAETAWIGSGALCGARGQGIPLIGFAVRQKAAPGGTQVDCEYAGSFQSGALAGPARNGAPCRSAIDNDPLEGVQLRITPRPAPPAAALPASKKTA